MNVISHLLHTATIRDALKHIDDAGTSLSTLFIVDKEMKLLGTLTDGDIRRGLIKGHKLDENVAIIMHTAFQFVTTNDLQLHTGNLNDLRLRDIRFVPVLDGNEKLIDVLDLESTKDILPMDAFLLAGGKGERLLPVTRTLPKPMIVVGDKPIIGHNALRLVSYGITNIYISVSYLAESIMQYFGNGSQINAQVKYVQETVPLGTLGSLSLVEGDLSNHILVMNSDLLTNLDFSDFYTQFLKSGADMAVVVKPYYHDLPYAVLQTDEAGMVTALREKPRYTYNTNAGIYIISKSLLHYIEKGKPLDATDFIEQMIAAGKRVFSYPIINYWLDIGKPEDLLKAMEDIKHLKL